jgi:hypothetical protein
MAWPLEGLQVPSIEQCQRWSRCSKESGRVEHVIRLACCPGLHRSMQLGATTTSSA